ncbi:MAG: hypothetical protein Kow0029_07200 [Candidatus Rifleibacteriota bacterium]
MTTAQNGVRLPPLKMVDFIMRKSIRTYPMSQRHNLVKKADFAKITAPDFSIRPFIESLPWQHAGKVLRKVVNSIIKARMAGRPVILGMGAHVVKCGLNPWLIKLLREKILTGIALNGAGSIHDFELAAFGETSEDVAKELAEGRFGCVEETGAWMSEAIEHAAKLETGMGRGIYEWMKSKAELFPEKETSLLWTCGELNVPLTVHVAIGTDFIHIHDKMNGASLGAASFTDFEIFCDQVEELENGVYWNLGSAVILPEVFLKAVSRAHNLGNSLNGMTTINMDMITQYRSITNVVKRPSIGVGEGLNLTGHHEIMLPLVAMAVSEGIKDHATF